MRVIHVRGEGLQSCGGRINDFGASTQLHLERGPRAVRELQDRVDLSTRRVARVKDLGPERLGQHTQIVYDQGLEELPGEAEVSAQSRSVAPHQCQREGRVAEVPLRLLS